MNKLPKMKMKKILLRGVVSVFLGVFMLGVNAFADVSNTRVYVPKNVYGGALTDYQNDICAYAIINVQSVYPTDGSYDNYQYVNVKLLKGSATSSLVLHGEKKIKEGSGWVKLQYQYNMAKGDEMTYLFKGNNPEYDAYAIVSVK